MRKYIVIIMLLALSSLCFAGGEGKYLRIRLGGSFPGEIQDVNDTKNDSKEGIEVMIEGVYRINDKFEVASGLGYQEHGKIKATDADTFYSIPLYISGKYNIFSGPLYAKILGGISFNKSRFDISDAYSTNHGYYVGAGLGLEFGNFELEGMYSINSISFNYKTTEDGEEITKDTDDMLDIRIAASISYKFSL